MGKICPKCNAVNKDSADFCENCGELFPEESGIDGWKKQRGALVKAVGLLVMVSFVGFILVSGFFTFQETSLGETFSRDGLTFDYPIGWEVVDYPGDVVSGGSSVKDIGTLTGSNITLSVSEADLEGKWSVENAKEATLNNLKNYSAIKVLSDINKTVNGITVYEMTGTVEDPTTSQESKFLYVVTGKDRDVCYYLQFIADTTYFNDNENIINSIVDSIKIS